MQKSTPDHVLQIDTGFLRSVITSKALQSSPFVVGEKSVLVTVRTDSHQFVERGPQWCTQYVASNFRTYGHPTDTGRLTSRLVLIDIVADIYPDGIMYGSHEIHANPPQHRTNVAVRLQLPTIGAEMDFIL